MQVVIRALIGDVAQRVLTLNKTEQRRHLAGWLHRLQLPPRARVLDFGCGTGLFATTVTAAGYRYTGYDPDAESVRYAARLYADGRFVDRLEALETGAPYDLVLANCCFHHIDDAALADVTLSAIARLMHTGSVFLLIDVLPLERGASGLRRVYNVFEQGARKRTADEFERLLAGRFAIRSRGIQRSHVLSAATRLNPLFNDLLVYELALP